MSYHRISGLLRTAGGNDAGRTYRTYDRAQVQRQWDDDVARSQHEDGTSYSGEIGMLTGPIQWHDKKLGSLREAWDWVMETHDKFEPPLAVSFELEADVPQARLEEWRRKEREAYEAYQRKVGEVVQRALTSGKSKLLPACRGCGSKLSREHIARGARGWASAEGVPCPVCRGNLLSEAVRKRLETLKSRHESRRGKEPRGRKTGKYGWVVGGVAQS